MKNQNKLIKEYEKRITVLERALELACEYQGKCLKEVRVASCSETPKYFLTRAREELKERDGE